MRASRLPSIAATLIPLVLAGITYWLWWQPKRFIDVEPYPLTFMTASFWATVVALVGCGVLMRRRLRLAILPLLIAALVASIPASTALMMTSWWLQGIPQAEIRAKH